jgi:hypothetical protein
MKITIKKALKAVVPYGLVIIWRILTNRKKVPKTADLEWAMSINEQKLFKEYIANANIYMEFGSGGSTIAALINTNAKVYSVESSKEWINQMFIKYDIITKSRDTGRLNLIHADIGPTGDWGAPLTDNKESGLFLSYTQEVFEKYPDVKLSDVVLIDGRFRVACLLYTLLNTGVDTLIMIHDFWNRPNYHIIKKYIDIIDGIDTLMVCKKKYNVSTDEIKKEYDMYKYIFE